MIFLLKIMPIHLFLRFFYTINYASQFFAVAHCRSQGIFCASPLPEGVTPFAPSCPSLLIFSNKTLSNFGRERISLVPIYAVAYITTGTTTGTFRCFFSSLNIMTKMRRLSSPLLYKQWAVLFLPPLTVRENTRRNQ
jgi:hypothetical protein